MTHEIAVCFHVIVTQAKASVPVMLHLMEALVAALQQVGKLQDRPCKFRVSGSAGIHIILFVKFSLQLQGVNFKHLLLVQQVYFASGQQGVCSLSRK